MKQKVYVIYRHFETGGSLELPASALPEFEVDPKGKWLTRNQVFEALYKKTTMHKRCCNDFCDDLFGKVQVAEECE